MKYFSKIISLCILLSMICCFVPVITGAESPGAQSVDKSKEIQPGTVPPDNNGNPPDFVTDLSFQERMVKDLESQGVDTAGLKAAIASGDKEKIRAVMDALKDKFPRQSMNGQPGDGGHGPQDFANNTTFQEQIVNRLESKGVDTTELKAALASGDQGKIRTVMEGLRDKLPQPFMNGTSGNAGMPQGNDRPQEKLPGKQASEPNPAGQPQQTQQAQPAQTQSPLSPLTVLAGIGIVGFAVISLRRE